jgi:hypothetical protein
LYFNGLTFAPGSGAELTLHGLPFLAHRIQATSNLALGNWANFSTNLADALGVISVRDFQPLALPGRYYRAVCP